jgi:fructoselysine-6-P-deglycase FrlB-like protein
MPQSATSSVAPHLHAAVCELLAPAGDWECLRAAAANGARTIAITAKPDALQAAMRRAPGAPGASPGVAGAPGAGASRAPDIIVATPLVDASWCHTVGYVSPLLALTAIAGVADSETCFRVIDATLALRDRFAAAARTLAPAQRLIVTGSGVDEITARELALKIEEGTHVPVTPIGIEKVLHGHLPAADRRTGIVIIRAHPGAERDKRAGDVRAAAAVLNLPTVTIDGLPEGHPLLAGAVALQLLTLELVHALGTNPDLIRREEEPYRAAAAAANT